MSPGRSAETQTIVSLIRVSILWPERQASSIRRKLPFCQIPNAGIQRGPNSASEKRVCTPLRDSGPTQNSLSHSASVFSHTTHWSSFAASSAPFAFFVKCCTASSKDLALSSFESGLGTGSSTGRRDPVERTSPNGSKPNKTSGIKDL